MTSRTAPPSSIKNDGIIELDSELGKRLGFTSDKFDGYLWKIGNYIYISFIESKNKGKGNFSRFLQEIIKAGFGIKVPTPMGRMPLILAHKGFKPTTEFFPEVGEDVDVWVLEAK